MNIPLTKDKLIPHPLLLYKTAPDVWSAFVKDALEGLKKEYLHRYPSEVEEFEELLDKWFPVFKKE